MRNLALRKVQPKHLTAINLRKRRFIENTQSKIPNYQSKIPNRKSKILRVCRIDGCAADKQTKPDETGIDQNPATASQ